MSADNERRLTAVMPNTRCEPTELEMWKAAAAKEDRPLAQWVRRELNRAARKAVDPPRE